MGKGRGQTKIAAKRSTKRPTLAGLKRMITALSAECAGWRDRATAAEHKLANPEFEDAMDAARRWHDTEIRRIVDDAIRDVNAPDRDRQVLDARGFLGGYLESWINPDRHIHCLVPAMASMVLACSENADSYENEFGSDPVADTATRAAHAMRVDAWQLLESRAEEWKQHVNGSETSAVSDR